MIDDEEKLDDGVSVSEGPLDDLLNEDEDEEERLGKDIDADEKAWE